jgi:hypothetical protein
MAGGFQNGTDGPLRRRDPAGVVEQVLGWPRIRDAWLLLFERGLLVLEIGDV